MTIRAAILGPTGYTGLFLIQLLSHHPSARITYLASHREELPDITQVFPQLLGRVDPSVAMCRPIDPEAIAKAADVVFLGLPHRAAMAYVPGLLDAGLRVIDLSADYRLSDAELYAKVYGHTHDDRKNLKDAVYGLPELFRDDLPGAMLIANPGCYPTAAALAIAPLLKHGVAQTEGIIINAASGVTGAGKSPAPHLHFAEQNESFLAYGNIGGHRHQPELEQTLTIVAGQPINTLFVPHLLPLDRGIHETIYLDPVNADVTQEDLFDAYRQEYSEDTFVRIRKDLPNVKNVRDTNFCDLTIRLAGPPDQRKIVAFSAIDNMIKGASGQAIQNMNLVFELDETTGLL
ncbi:MAG: N-acetyl-gamma-glutamyl-phosphate reductase [Phycisphaeraceae bacterium]|nr:N-acetyl-gamma-glutamyl-phosphate reductase [Phycisphaeraceae bacterium]